MKDRNVPPVILRLHGQPADGLERLLTDFYRSEMPDPWPALETPEWQGEQAPRRSWSFGWLLALRPRLALAASIALLVTGYLLLASAFPGAPTAGTGMQDHTGPLLGGKPAVKPLITPEDRAIIFTETTKGDKQIQGIQHSSPDGKKVTIRLWDKH
jgi:hypothetical protein